MHFGMLAWSSPPAEVYVEVTWSVAWLCQTGWSEYLRHYWDFHIQPSRYPVRGSCVIKNALLMFNVLALFIYLFIYTVNITTQ